MATPQTSAAKSPSNKATMALALELTRAYLVWRLHLRGLGIFMISSWSQKQKGLPVQNLACILSGIHFAPRTIKLNHRTTRLWVWTLHRQATDFSTNHSLALKLTSAGEKIRPARLDNYYMLQVTSYRNIRWVPTSPLQPFYSYNHCLLSSWAS